MGTHVKKFETFLVATTSFMNKNLSIFKNTFVNVTGMVFFRFNRSWFERMLRGYSTLQAPREQYDANPHKFYILGDKL